MISNDFITTKELEIFVIPTFAERMERIRSEISPKLELLGSSLADGIAKGKGTLLHFHVAKHARRSVNPPDETWVAFSPSARGYKNYAHFAVGVGYFGAFVKLMAKADAQEKTALADAILDMGSPRKIWLQKGPDVVEVKREDVVEAIEKKSYGLETGKVLESVPGDSFDDWYHWALAEIDALWPLYQYVRKKV